MSPGAPTSVLVGFAEALAGPEVVWSLVDAGFRVEAFCRRGTRPPIASDKRVRVHAITAPEIDARAAIADLNALCRSAPWAALLPIDDPALWTAGALPPDGPPIAGHSPDTISLALDKRRQIDVLDAAGLPPPPTISVTENTTAVPGSFPIIIKPALAAFELDGRLTRGRFWRCQDSDAFQRARDEWAARWPVLVQEVVRGEGRGLFAIGDGARALAPSAHRRARMMHPDGSGSSACQSVVPSDGQLRVLDAFVASTGWRGMFMIEFIRTPDGRDLLMELNGRAWGSMALARRCGLEYPAWTVSQTLGRPLDLPTSVPPEGVLCRHLGREIVHLLHVLRGPTPGSHAQWPSRARTLASLLSFRRGQRWYNAQRPRVMLRDAWTTIARKVRP